MSTDLQSASNGEARTAYVSEKRLVHKVVLTGGPCAGKTTALERIRTFFESLQWKVYTVTEAATVLLGGGIKFETMSAKQVMDFNINIIRTIMQMEKTFFDLAEEDSGNVIIVCDRGTMDPFAFIPKEKWEDIFHLLGQKAVQLRDERYDQVVHMVSAAIGAEAFYQTESNSVRLETVEEAIERDHCAAGAWVGHPYYDLVDNSTDFENKIRRVIGIICKHLNRLVGVDDVHRRLEVDINERLKAQSKKRKFLVRGTPDPKLFPSYQDFEVQHDYLKESEEGIQSRIRKRGQKGFFTYAYTKRRLVTGTLVERVKRLPQREYETLYQLRDPGHQSIVKIRRCFLWKSHYFQLDYYQKPLNKRCDKLILLETYTTTHEGSDGLALPDFLSIEKEVTCNKDYSMFTLSACSS